MKAVFPSKTVNPTLDSELEPVFGDAKAYLIIGSDTENFVVLKNEKTRDEECHMGSKFIELGVDTVVSCELCKHCMQNLKDLDIDVWKCDGSSTIRESYNKFILGGIFARIEPDIVECQHSKNEQAMLN